MQIDNPTLRVAWNVTKEHPWRIALLFLFTSVEIKHYTPAAIWKLVASWSLVLSLL